MTKWEYLICLIRDSNGLNELGLDGWEVCGIVDRQGGPCAILKRPLPMNEEDAGQLLDYISKGLKERIRLGLQL